MSLHGKEKIYFLVSLLLDEREVTAKGQPVALHPMNDLNNHYSKMDFIQLTEKLEKEHKAIKLLNKVPTDQTLNKYLIELLPDFDKYVLELRKDPKYLNFIGEKPEQEQETNTEPISVNHARNNGIMTGKEKIQAVIEEINDKYQGLVTGNVVVLHSGNLEQRGLKMHEQKQVLDILTKDKKAIKYTAKNEYKDRAEIHPRDQVDVLEVAMDDMDANEMFDRILEQQLYEVEVLATFEALANQLLGDAEIEYNKDVYLLRLLYNRVISVLDAVVAAGIVIEDDELDTMYVQLTALIEDVFSKPSMKDWKKDAPELYETLLGHSEEIGEGWQYDRANVMKYYAKLQKDWMLKGKPEFELEDKLATMLEDVYKIIGTHRKIANNVANDLHKSDTDRLKKGLQGIGKQEQPDTEPIPKKEPIATTNKKVKLHPLQPNHYHDRTGKLAVSPTVEVEIAKRGKVKRKNGSKYDQCHLMSRLFKGVNTINNGITFSTFLGVKYDKNNKKHIRRIRNTIYEINKKVSDKTTAKKLILLQGEKITIDKSYL